MTDPPAHPAESRPASPSPSPASAARSRRRGRLLPRLVIYVVLGILVYFALVFLLQRQVLFPRYMIATELLSPAPPSDAEVVWIDTDQGRVEAWFLPGRGVSGDNPGPVVLYAHGNGEVMDPYAEVLAPYREMGLSLMLLEYRGYGRSEGSPSQSRITADFIQFHDWLIQREKVDSERLVYHGFSLGGAALAQLARHRPPRAMILESSFTSVRRMAAPMLVPPFLIRDPFDTLSVVRRLDRPILIRHGRRDGVVPFHHARRLHEAAPDSELIATAADHQPLLAEDGFDRIERFLRRTGVLEDE